MIYIENGDVKLGILPDVGGRIVSLQINDGENILESDSNLWNEAKRIRPSSKNLEFKAYNGHEVWVGPQSQWWKRQSLNKEKIDSDLFWPPDPYISYDKYNIITKSDNYIVLKGHGSPISGIRFTKNIIVGEYDMTDECYNIFIEVTAENIRKKPIAWDIWMLTRVNGHNLNFVPVADEKDVTVSEPTHPHQGPAPYTIKDGYFSFTPKEKDKDHEECTAKAFISPSRPFIATLSGRTLLQIFFLHQEQQLLHPEQREVEIYNFATDRKETSLLELEYHSPYQTIPPGGVISATEVWKIHRFSKDVTESDIKSYLNKTT
ncbi:MAG: DUF4380 domain-containing protein [Paludibacteraceae bacterium]|nr:DUF4380 domain-containing protein [Prevotellaceae bacterium]